MSRVARAATVPIERPTWSTEDLAWVVAELRPEVEPVADDSASGLPTGPSTGRPCAGRLSVGHPANAR